ncbi:unnamed protein product [Clonostachys rosea f. rosea IK726]|uniref:Uncharacterized protein n=1 Tax=Clonostachys rosea f. rosea IK726 TaxID=1349383 RepID=A0ACA9UQ35_BIOOC|nr:unnamed protein product [Clonostachys rosea f. rosea IK726]
MQVICGNTEGIGGAEKRYRKQRLHITFDIGPIQSVTIPKNPLPLLLYALREPLVLGDQFDPETLWLGVKRKSEPEHGPDVENVDDHKRARPASQSNDGYYNLC